MCIRDRDFRFPIQYVLRPNLDFRGFCGKVASGIIRKGDEVMALLDELLYQRIRRNQ